METVKETVKFEQLKPEARRIIVEICVRAKLRSLVQKKVSDERKTAGQ